jgi:zinc protease
MLRLKILFTFLALICFFITYSQAPNRKSPPPFGTPKNLQLPSIRKFSLANGLNVVLMEKHNVPLVQINFLARTGSYDDPQGKEGLANLTMDLMDEGAGSFDALKLADEIEFLGASIQTYAGGFNSGVNCSTPVSKLDPALKLMSDIILKPTFSEQELERVRKLRLNALLTQYDEPTIIAQRAFDQLLFDRSLPYGKAPGEQSLKSITRNDLSAFHRSLMVGGNPTIIIVGDVERSSLEPLLSKYFGAAQIATVKKQPLPEPQQIKGRTIYIVDKPGAAQSVIRIGRIAAARNSPDYENMVVMNTILGGSFTSRLNTNLRETHGYAYGAGSGFSFWSVASPFVASSSVQTDVTGPALGEFFNEFNNMIKPLPDADLTRGKNYEALGYAGEFETNSQIAGALASMVVHNLPDNYFNTYVEKILNVNKKGVEAVAKKYVVPNNVLVVVVGDRAKIEEGINKLKLGKVTMLSVEDVLGKKPQL